ncbi:hypothetical protein EJ07DRAFT_154973 [Lizonia empirigonia]|nr:hypothetical protein EJ07DRAFT_154973 [Lizonia empirigonia]
MNGLPHPHTSPQNATLFSLPQEFRNEIFRLVLTTDTGYIHLFEEKGKLRPGLSSTSSMPRDWFVNVRSVTLLGNFPVGHEPDENVLHGYFKFTAAHKDASICVHVPGWSILANLTAFLTLGYRIREAVRGVTTPCYIRAHKGTVKKWRCDKQLAFLDQKNVRFFPSVAWNEGRDVKHVKKYTQGKLRFREELIKDHGNAGNLVALVKMWHVKGI